MTNYVSVSIPERLARRASELARARRQSLDTIVADLVEQGLPVEDQLDVQQTAFSIGEDAEQAMTSESAAYVAMHAELMASYGGQFVAIHGGQLVDHDVDETALLRRVEAQYPDTIVLLKRVVPLPELELRIRSPRT